MNSLLAVTRAAMTPAARTKLALDGELNDAMGLYRKGQLAEAESAFLRALELTRHDDEYASVLRKLAVVYEKMGRADDAQEAWEYANIPVIRPPLVTGIDPDAPRRADEGDDHHQQQQQQQQQQLLQLQAAEMGPGLTAAEMVAQQQEENARLVLSEADRMNQNRRFARSVVEMIRVDDQALVSPRFADTFSDTLTEPPREGLNGDADGRPNSNSAAATRAVAASGTRGGSGGNGSSGASGAVQRGRPRHRKAKKRGKTLDELRKMMREPELEGVAAYKMGKVYMRMKQAQKALRMLKRGLKAEKRRLAEIHVDHGQRILEEKKIRSRTKRAQLEQAEREIERYKELVSSERLTSDIHRALFDLMLNAAADLIATDDHGEETGAAGAGDNDRAALVAAARNAETNAADDATDATLASPLVSLDPSDPSALVTAGSRPSSTSGERAGDILLPQSRSFLLPNVAASSAAATKMEAECAFHGRTWLRTLSDRTAAPAHAADRFTHPLRSRPAHLRYVGRRTAGAWVGPLATLRTEVLEELAESGPGSIDQGLLQDLGAMHMRQGHFARAQEVMERRVASEKERASMARGVGLGVGPMGLGIGAARWETQATGRVAGMQADGTLAWHTGHGPGLARTVTVPALIQPGLAQAAGRAGHGGRAGQAAQGTGEWRRIARAGYGGTLGAPDIRRGDKLPEDFSAMVPTFPGRNVHPVERRALSPRTLEVHRSASLPTKAGESRKWDIWRARVGAGEVLQSEIAAVTRAKAMASGDTASKGGSMWEHASALSGNGLMPGWGTAVAGGGFPDLPGESDDGSGGGAAHASAEQDQLRPRAVFVPESHPGAIRCHSRGADGKLIATTGGSQFLAKLAPGDLSHAPWGGPDQPNMPRFTGPLRLGSTITAVPVPATGPWRQEGGDGGSLAQQHRRRRGRLLMQSHASQMVPTSFEPPSFEN